jgi:hypothetical protein
LAWAVLIGLYLALGVAGAVYLAPTTVIGQDLATYQRAGDLLWAGENPYSAQSDLGQEDQYRYPPLLAMVIPILGFPPLWYGLMAAATVATIWLWYRTAGPAGLLVPALLVGAWGQQLLNGNSQALVVYLLAITPLLAVGSGPRWSGPAVLALATMLKLHPVIGLVWFAGRRDGRAIALYLVACGVLLIPQLPWLGDFVRYYLTDPAAVETIPGMSLRAIHPAVWVVGVVVILGVAWRVADTRYGWLLATVAQLVALPRVLLVNLALLMAAPLPPRRVSPPAPPSDSRTDPESDPESARSSSPGPSATPG